MSAQLVLGLVGIGLSILFFFIGYRNTIEAIKERIKIVNKEIVDILLKRLILEDYILNFEELIIFIDGKAKSHLLNSKDVINKIDVVNILYSQIIENDFIKAEQRKKILERLNIFIKKNNNEEVSEDTNIFDFKKSILSRLILLFVSLALSIMIISIISYITHANNVFSLNRSDISATLLITLTGGAVSILTISIFKRLKEKEEEIKPDSLFVKHIIFEKQTEELLRANKLSFYKSLKGSFDFEVKSKDKIYLIELKITLRRYSLSVLNTIIKSLEVEVLNKGAVKGILVSSELIPERVKKMQNERIVIIDFQEFKQFITNI